MVAWHVRYFFALGFLFGALFGASLIRAVEHGGLLDWASPALLLAAALAIPFVRIRRRGDEAELR